MGGVQHSTFLLTEQIIKDKTADVRIILPGEGQFSRLCKENKIPYNTYNQIQYVSTSVSWFNDRLRIPNLFAWIFNIYAILINSIRIKKIVEQDFPHLAITKGLHSHFSAGMACKSLNLPVVWHLQDLISQRHCGILDSIFNYLAEKIPDHIICDGKVIRNSLKKVVRQRATTVLNGIKIDDLCREKELGLRTRQELGIPANAYVVGNMARIVPWKGQELLLNVFTKYSELNQNSYLLLVGSPFFYSDKYFKYLMQLIDEYGLGKRVIMPGYRSDLKEIFSAMDIFIYPSLEKDTSPLALLSAISAGLPAIVSDIKCLEEVIDLCSAVDVFDLRNWEELLSLIVKYEDENFRIKNGKKNWEAGKMYFDIGIHSKKMMNIFDLTLSGE
jgi:glycosyltransferase involved in cell wall biosynthesis